MRKPVLLLGALVALLVPAAAADAATPGINVNQSALVAAGDATGAKLARSFVVYPASAPTALEGNDAYDLDQIVQGYASAGVKPILVVTGKGAPPTSVANYASYVGSIVARYGAKLAGIEVWNEEDEAIWWGTPGGDPATYAALLRATYAAVGGAVPVVLGGMTGNNYTFLNTVYAALGGSSNGAFDAVGVHTDTACSLVGPDSFYRNPDGRISQYSFLGLREVYSIMQAHGDGDKKIWMTELGWSTSGATCDSGVSAGKKAGGVTPAQQASYLTMAYHCLQAYPYVQNALWFTLQDDGTAPNNMFGLTDSGGTNKPAYAAFQDVIAGKDDDAGQACGDFTPPTITVDSPGANGVFYDDLRISATATDSSGVGRVSLAADGKLIRNFTTGKTDPAQYPKSLAGAIDWQGAKKLGLGPHTITVTALDGNGNAATTTVHVTKVSLSALKNLAVKFTTFTISKKGTTRTLKVGVAAPKTAPIGFKATNKVTVTFQKLVKGRWKTAHKYTKGLGKGSKNPFTIKVKLQKAKWRAQATFPAKAPFKSAKSTYLRFTV